MNIKARAAQEDIAFLRELVESSQSAPIPGGAIFLVGGLLYGGQTLFHWCQAMGWLAPSTVISLFVSIAPTVAFLLFLTYSLRQQRKSTASGIARRALDAGFSAAGLCNTVLAAVFAWAAIQQKDLYIWLLYPIVVFALQGAAWQIAYQLQRRFWMGVISWGWFVATIGLGLSLKTFAYGLIASLSLFLLMALPGALMLRSEKQPSESWS
ncbi:MAG: hypothetical protein QM758_03115 [Armatimonas sp.]